MEFKTVQSSFFFGFLSVSTILFFWLIGSFAFTIFWAIFFTIVFYPVYNILLQKTKEKKGLSSLITIILILFIIIIPVSFTSYLIVDEIPKINQNILEKNNLNDLLDKLPFKNEIESSLIKNNIDPAEVKENIIQSLKESLNSLGGKIISLGKDTLNILIHFVIMIYLIYFGLRDGKKYLLSLSKILPLGDKTEKRLFRKFSSIVRSIFKGTLIVSIAQGVLGGLLFLIVGIEGVLIWTIIMIITAMIPAIGIGIVLVPTALFSILIGNVGEALVLLIGLTMISTVDNILRPYLIGKETEMPDMIITISILGGLSLFGITGLVIGPVIAGFFITMWHLFEEKYQDNLDNNE